MLRRQSRQGRVARFFFASTPHPAILEARKEADRRPEHRPPHAPPVRGKASQWTGTQDGPYDGRPATGNKLVFSTADYFRIENGKIAEHWDVVDLLARAVGLGLVPPPKASAPTSPPKSP